MKYINHAIAEEFNEIDVFLSKKYGVHIKQKEQLVDFTISALHLVLSVKIWQKHLTPAFEKNPGIEMYFQEMLSNSIHIVVLGNIDMKIPAIVMLRRTLEQILSYLYYSEHPIELYKKEIDDNERILLGFKELKDYLKSYPFSIKYNIDECMMQQFMGRILNDWTQQYKELSNYVHGTNSSFFQSAEYVDEFKFVKKDVSFLTKQVNTVSSIINALLMIFYFDSYIAFDENTEKKILRYSISNTLQYKNKIVEILKEV